jgi:hypothetical protein
VLSTGVRAWILSNDPRLDFLTGLRRGVKMAPRSNGWVGRGRCSASSASKPVSSRTRPALADARSAVRSSALGASRARSKRHGHSIYASMPAATSCSGCCPITPRTCKWIATDAPSRRERGPARKFRPRSKIARYGQPAAPGFSRQRASEAQGGTGFASPHSQVRQPCSSIAKELYEQTTGQSETSWSRVGHLLEAPASRHPCHGQLVEKSRLSHATSDSPQ